MTQEMSENDKAKMEAIWPKEKQDNEKKSYTICSIRDIYNLPENRISAFMVDLHVLIEQVRYKEMEFPSSIEWIDGEITEIQFNLPIHDQNANVPSL